MQNDSEFILYSIAEDNIENAIKMSLSINIMQGSTNDKYDPKENDEERRET